MILEPQAVLDRLARCPDYAVTPLDYVDGVFIKDERERLGLGSFKALGGAYAVARLLSEHGRDQVVCCASAGNHGLSVAAGARLFGCRSVVFLDHGVPPDFEERLSGWGARVVRTGRNYEESMAAATSTAEREGWLLVSDSSWPGYLEVPRLVMEGYTVIAWEMEARFRELERWPERLYLQAGVGGLAAALTWSIRKRWPRQPRILVVEPEAAPCLRESHRRGEPVAVEGPASVMGRLDCKEPSLLAFQVLHELADEFLLVSDAEAELAAEELARLGYPTTPSGAAGYAGMKQAGSAGACVVVTERAVGR